MAQPFFSFPSVVTCFANECEHPNARHFHISPGTPFAIGKLLNFLSSKYSEKKSSGELAQMEVQARGFDYGFACRMGVFPKANREKRKETTEITEAPSAKRKMKGKEQGYLVALAPK
jgi:hypothetical protein